jgi:hypothetical protein
MAAGGITGGAAKPRLDELDRRVDCPRVTQLDRFAQGWQPDRNPLRRTSDRAETALLAVLFIAFFAAAPFVVQACGTMAHAAAHRVQLAEQASWHQVPAVLLHTAPGSVSYAGIQAEVQARWTAPDGKKVTGEVPVPPAAVAGSTFTIWTSRDGQLTDPPLQNSQVAGQTDLAETFGGIALATTLIIIGMLVRRALDRRRLGSGLAGNRPRWTPRR